MTANKSQIRIISIEGNIGSGKSTLLAHLKKVFSDKPIVFLKEPVEEWEKIKDEHNFTMLENFYKDPNKYSFPFQMMAYISRLQLLKEAVERYPDYIILTERSLYTDKLVFAKMLYDTQKIEYINYQIYLKWFDTFSKDFQVEKIIYVQAEPNICNARILKRSRNGENNISLDYLITCDKYHDDMLKTMNKKTLILDGNINIYENNDIIEKWTKNIENFIKS